MVLADVGKFKKGLTGKVAQRALEKCGIIVDSYRLANQREGSPPSGVRLGTGVISRRGMGTDEIEIIAEAIEQVLKHLRLDDYGSFGLPEVVAASATEKVRTLCHSFAFA